MVDDHWATQLKKIEREFEGLPPEPSPAYQKLQTEEERRAKERALTRAAVIGSSARLVLVLALGAALVMWPYSRACGSGWLSYVGVEGMIVAGGVWVGITTWRARLAKLHVLSLLIVLDRTRIGSSRSPAANRLCGHRPAPSTADMVRRTDERAASYDNAGTARSIRDSVCEQSLGGEQWRSRQATPAAASRFRAGAAPRAALAAKRRDQVRGNRLING